VVGQRKGTSGANAPPVHGIKKCLVVKRKVLLFKNFISKDIVLYFNFYFTKFLSHFLKKLMLNRNYFSF
jgi:hypothetical protein